MLAWVADQSKANMWGAIYDELYFANEMQASAHPVTLAQNSALTLILIIGHCGHLPTPNFTLEMTLSKFEASACSSRELKA